MDRPPTPFPSSIVKLPTIREEGPTASSSSSNVPKVAAEMAAIFDTVSNIRGHLMSSRGRFNDEVRRIDNLLQHLSDIDRHLGQLAHFGSLYSKFEKEHATLKIDLAVLRKHAAELASRNLAGQIEIQRLKTIVKMLTNNKDDSNEATSSGKSDNAKRPCT